MDVVLPLRAASCQWKVAKQCKVFSQNNSVCIAVHAGGNCKGDVTMKDTVGEVK